MLEPLVPTSKFLSCPTAGRWGPLVTTPTLHFLGAGKQLATF